MIHRFLRMEGGVGWEISWLIPWAIETFQKLSSYHILMPWIFLMRLRVFVNASESGTKLSHTSSLSAYYCVCLPWPWSISVSGRLGGKWNTSDSSGFGRWISKDTELLFPIGLDSPPVDLNEWFFFQSGPVWSLKSLSFSFYTLPFLPLHPVRPYFFAWVQPVCWLFYWPNTPV